jgi:uncharacterized protein (DUF697 family)
MGKNVTPDWSLVVTSAKEVAHVREKCRSLVRRRAAIAAGVGAVPIPGVEVMSDVSLFALMVEDINKSFGLTEAQIGRMQPKFRTMAYSAAASAGGALVGKLITKEVVLALLKRAGMKMAARSASKIVPIAGQIASAAIGFAVFRQMGYQHVEACAKVAQELLNAKNVTPA